MMASVVQKIQQELGVEVKHIPGGCTFLCQPVDVGFNKPFKDRLWEAVDIVDDFRGHRSWHDKPSNKAGQAMADMKAEHGIVRNAWMKSGFEWFDKNKGVVDGGESPMEEMIKLSSVCLCVRSSYVENV